jgi:hypothetical protein
MYLLTSNHESTGRAAPRLTQRSLTGRRRLWVARPGQQDVSVPAAWLPGMAHVPFCVPGAEMACSVAEGSMQACHEVINDGEGLVEQWRVTRLTLLGILGPLTQAEADGVGWHQIAQLARHGCARRWPCA